MTDLPYRLEPAPGYDEYKVTSLLKDHLVLLMENSENQETIDQILKLIKRLLLPVQLLIFHQQFFLKNKTG